MNENNLDQNTQSAQTLNTTPPLNTQPQNTTPPINAQPIIGATNTVAPAANVVPSQPVENVNLQPTINAQPQISSYDEVSLLTLVKGAITKPLTNIKNNLKNSMPLQRVGILFAATAALFAALKVVATFLTILFTKTSEVCFYDICVESPKTTFAERFESIEWLKLLWNGLWQPLVVVLLLGFVYYIVALAMKKQPNFIKISLIVLLSLIPYYLVINFISPIMGYVWSPLAVIVTGAASLITMVILVLSVKEEVDFEQPDMFIYYNAIVMLSLSTTVYVVVREILDNKFGGMFSALGF